MSWLLPSGASIYLSRHGSAVRLWHWRVARREVFSEFLFPASAIDATLTDVRKVLDGAGKHVGRVDVFVGASELHLTIVPRIAGVESALDWTAVASRQFGVSLGIQSDRYRVSIAILRGGSHAAAAAIAKDAFEAVREVASASGRRLACVKAFAMTAADRIARGKGRLSRLVLIEPGAISCFVTIDQRPQIDVAHVAPTSEARSRELTRLELAFGDLGGITECVALELPESGAGETPRRLVDWTDRLKAFER